MENKIYASIAPKVINYEISEMKLSKEPTTKILEIFSRNNYTYIDFEIFKKNTSGNGELFINFYLMGDFFTGLKQINISFKHDKNYKYNKEDECELYISMDKLFNETQNAYLIYEENNFNDNTEKEKPLYLATFENDNLRTFKIKPCKDGDKTMFIWICNYKGIKIFKI